MSLTSIKNRSILYIGGLVLLPTLLLAYKSMVTAGQLPDSGTGTSDTYLTTYIEGAYTAINVHTSVIMVTYDGSPAARTVDIYDGVLCDLSPGDPSSGIDTFGSTWSSYDTLAECNSSASLNRINFDFCKPSGGSCTSANSTSMAYLGWTGINVPASSFEFDSTTGTSSTLLTVSYQDTSVGDRNNAFKVRATGGYVGIGADGSRVAMQDRVSDGSKNTFNVYFGSPCSVGPVTTLTWYDADHQYGVPTPGIPAETNIRFELIDETTGTNVFGGWVDDGATLGGNKDTKSLNFTPQPDHRYRWTWENVSDNNGVQMILPIGYHGTNYNTSCDQPPSVSISTATCDPNGISGSASDPQGNVSVTFQVRNNANTGWVDIDSKSNFSGGYSFSFPDNYKDAYSRQIRVVVHNNGPAGSSLDRDATATVPPCTAPTCTTTAVNNVGDSISPEVGEYFGVSFNIQYSPGSNGRPLTHPRSLFHIYDAVTGTWVPSPSTSPEVFDFPYDVPTGSPQHTFNNGGIGYMFSTPGPRELHGRIRQSGAIGNNTYGDIDVPCNSSFANISFHPYLKVYNNDIRAGGRFESGGSCSSTSLDSNATILGRNLVTEDGNFYLSGASVELAAYALAEIDQFYSAGQKNPHYSSGTHDATPQNGLTFGNFPGSNYNGNAAAYNTGVTSTTIGSQTQGWGGEGGMSRCIPDYWSYSSDATHTDSSANVDPGTPAGSNGKVYLNTRTSGVRVRSTDLGTLPPGQNRQQTVFIDGDAYIAGNIIYSSNGATISDIPMFTLVVKGNIYIDNEVEQLDGLYIAVPDDPNNPSSSGGKIYTCANVSTTGSPSASLYSANQLFTQCAKKLTINGAFIAKRVKFLRTAGTIRSGLQPPQQMNMSFHDTDDARPVGKECINLSNSPGSNHGAWENNWMCVDPGQIAYFGLEWVTNGPDLPLNGTPGALVGDYGPGSAAAQARNNETLRPGKICTPFYEGAEVPGFDDNYLCYYKSTNIVLEFHYTTTGRPASDGITYNCDKVGITSWDDADTSGSSHTWSDNYLCQNVLPPFDYNESNASNNIAEVFNFSPEMYLSTPPGFQEQGGLESGKYNSIRTLPPLL